MATHTTSLPPELHRRALDALDAGRADEAYELLRAALSDAIALEWVNDLGVLAHRLGRDDEARALLQAVLAIEPGREDAALNIAAVTSTAPSAAPTAAWRGSATLGGADPQMYERAFPGMPRPDVMSEHCARYAFAQGHVGGADVLDLGCGTGYGSEMLSWSAASVRGFDIWQPREDERPRWPGVAALNYGHDLCVDPLPPADTAVMFECIEHLPDAPRALQIAWSAVDRIVGSFPNPVHHGSFMNQYHVNDWPLEQFERELQSAATAAGRGAVAITHFHQPLGSPLLVPGRDPEASFWVVVATVAARPRAAAPAPASAQPLTEPPPPSGPTASGALRLDDSAPPSVQDSVPPAVQVSPETPFRDYWQARARQHTSDRYLGIKTSKFPEDLRVYEHLMWVSAPNVIIELGAQSGGSTLWLRDRLRTLAHYRTLSGAPFVVAVDIDLSVARRNVAERDPDWPETIAFVEGDVCDPAVRAEVQRHIPAGATCMVIEDSAHVEATTRAALELYTDLVPVGGFFVVEDGCVDVEWMRIDEAWPRGVLPALNKWLTTEQGSSFTVRQDLEVYGLSCHPSGFLQRVR